MTTELHSFLSPGLIVAVADIAEAEALNLPITVIAVSLSEAGPIFETKTGQTPALEQVMLHAVGALALSAQGQDDLSRLAALWQDRLGEPAPALFKPVAAPLAERRLLVLEWVLAQLAAERRVGALRSTRMMRELGLLRRQHDETQAGFRNLEAFIYRSGLKQRSLDVNLSPVTVQRPLVLRSGSHLMQRLPGSSIGLSDIALHFSHEAAPAQGILQVSLSSVENNETLAIWEVPTQSLGRGWLRLALERALGADAVTLVLHLSYQGQGELRLSRSVQHPEPRFWPRLDGQPVEAGMPALQIWHWVAGASAPLDAMSIAPVGGKDRLRRLVSEALTVAFDMNAPASSLPLQPDTTALLVHVLPDRVAGGVLTDIALPGVHHIRADVRTWHGKGPIVEYGMALLPRSARRPSGGMPEIEPRFASDWVRLAPMEDGQVHLILPAPLDDPHDLYLLARLAEGVRSNAYGWSTFANVSLQY